MLNNLKHLWLAIALITSASAILLFSDTARRTGRSPETEFPSFAIMQISSTPLLDAHVAGIKEGLARNGLLAPDEKNLRVFNPQGDFSMANTIAREMVQGNYDLLITSSTIALQITAKANLNTKISHVFGAVTFPQGAGVGITGPGADEHPPWLTGIGTFQPVRRAFEIAREMNPSLRNVGVVWNPGEQCSEACLQEARAICSELGIELTEATAVQSSEVSDAVRSLLARNVEALWIGGDTVANAASEMIVHLAAVENIPVFTNDPSDINKGALFGVGADYHTVGIYTADMAAQIVKGQPASSFRIENVIPEQFCLNRSAQTALSAKWTVPDSIKERLTN